MMAEIIGVGQLALMDLNDAIVSGTPPSNPVVGTLWIDESQDPVMLKKWNGEAWIDLGELDPDISVTIEEITETLGNMANDNIINFQERQVIKDKLTEIIGYVIADTATALPTVSTLDNSGKGSFWSVRKSARNIGIPTNDATYVNVATKYNNLKSYLESLKPIAPWDTRNANADVVISVVKSTFRDVWLQYYLAVDALAELTAQKIKENENKLKNDVDIIGNNLNDLTGRVTNVETKVTDESIVSTVTRSEAWVQQTNIINSKATPQDINNAINNLKIGGRNLASKNNIGKWSNGWVEENYVYTLTGDKAGLYIKAGVFKAGERYVLTFKAKKISGTVTSLAGHCTNYTIHKVIRDGVLQSTNWSSGLDTNPYPDDGEVHDYEIHFTVKDFTSSDNNFYIQPNRLHYGLNYVMKIWDLMLEKSNKASDWSPAPEDVDAQIVDLNTQLTTVQSTIEQLPDQINLKVSERIESIEIGGRNLYRNSKGPFILNPRNTGQSSDNYNFYRFYCNMELNETYTISADIEITHGDFDKVTVYPYPGGTISNVPIPSNGRIKHTFVKTSETIDSVLIYAGLSGSTRGQGIIIRNVKIEKGHKATDWSPAPEDVQTEIDGLTGQVSNIQSQLTIQANQIATKVEKNGIISAINQTAESIKIQASKVDLSGYVTFTNLSTSGQTTIDGGNIKANSITANKLNVTSLSAISANLGTVTAGTIRGVYIYGSEIEGVTLRSSDTPNYFDPNYTERAELRAGLLSFESKGFLGAQLKLNVSGYGMYLQGRPSNLSVPSGYEPSTKGVMYIHNGLIEATDSGRDSSIYINAYKVGIGNSVGARFEFLSGSSYADAIFRIGGFSFESVFLGNHLTLYGGLNISKEHEHLILTESDNNNKQWYIGVQNGDLRFGEKSASVRMTLQGSSAKLQNNGVFSSILGYVVLRSEDNKYVYLQGSEVRATRPSQTSQYIPVRASSFPTGSLAEYKQDIKVWEGNALDIINNATIYDYMLNSDVESGKLRRRYGLVIGEGYNTPSEVIDGDGVEQYLMNSISWKAIQELSSIFNKHDDEINYLKLEVQLLRQKVKQLEEMIE